jgi:hypothetical protein
MADMWHRRFTELSLPVRRRSSVPKSYGGQRPPQRSSFSSGWLCTAGYGRMNAGAVMGCRIRMIATCAPRLLSPADISLRGVCSPGSSRHCYSCHWDCSPWCRPLRNRTSLSGGFAVVNTCRRKDTRHSTPWSCSSRGACGKRGIPGFFERPRPRSVPSPGAWWLRPTPGAWVGSSLWDVHWCLVAATLESVIFSCYFSFSSKFRVVRC